MSNLSDYARAILTGGLPAALDMGAKAGTAQGDNRTEQIKPVGTAQDRDNRTAAKPVSVVDYITSKEVMIGVVGVVVVGTVLYFAFRVVKKI